MKYRIKASVIREAGFVVDARDADEALAVAMDVIIGKECEITEAAPDFVISTPIEKEKEGEQVFYWNDYFEEDPEE